MDGGQTVLRSTAPDGGQTVVLTAAGMIGLTGCNSDGLGVCVNTLSMLNHSRRRPAGGVRAPRPARAAHAGRRRGVPSRRPARVGPALRDRVRRRRGRVRVLGGRRRRIGRRPGSVLAHEPSARKPRRRPGRRRSGGDGRLAGPPRPARRTGPDIETVDDCERLLADRRAPLCVAPEAEHKWLTFGSIAMELTSPPATPDRPGPADRTAWLDAAPAA